MCFICLSLWNVASFWPKDQTAGQNNALRQTEVSEHVGKISWPIYLHYTIHWPKSVLFQYSTHMIDWEKQHRVGVGFLLHRVSKVCPPCKKSPESLSPQKNQSIQKPVCLPFILITASGLWGMECTKFLRTAGSILSHSFVALDMNRFVVVRGGLRKTLLFRIPQQFSIGIRTTQQSFSRKDGFLVPLKHVPDAVTAITFLKF